MMGTLQMSVSRAGRVRVVAAAGCLDVNTRGWLADFVEGVLDAAAEIVVDLSEVRLCDAASMATLVRIAERCAGHGGWLRLAAPKGQVARAFAIIAFGQDVPTYATVLGAVAGDETERVKD